jgi:hypothetical protein
MCHVTWKQNALCTQINPGERQVGIVDTPIFSFLLDMCFEAELMCATSVACKETPVIFPIIFLSNETADLKNRWKHVRIIVSRGC